ncbi:MAG TPA: DUF1569 domain-containing protein [Candidatus Angelobacter sp.]|nr:DUF1569 domain-containing protein [Candidatus Angelobacter sp.]
MKTLGHSEDAEEILRRLSALSPSSKRRWGKMSVQQMVCHLTDGFLLYMGEKTAQPAATLLPGKLLKWGALWTPLPWPHGFKTVPELDQETGGTSPDNFETDVARLQQCVRRFTDNHKDFAWPSAHPHFGSMSEADWQRLAYLHADHHFRQFGC